MFQTLSFIETSNLDIAGAIAKIGSLIELSILRKINKYIRTLKEYSHFHGEFPIYYTRKLSYFVQILDFVPKIIDGNGDKREPSELKKLLFQENKLRDIFLALLNSTTFYWLLTVYSDCRNLNKREVDSMHFDVSKANELVINKLVSMCRNLMNDIEANSKMLTMNYKKLGTLQIQCTYPRYSKQIIDQIDRVLGQYYDFTDEELDFIINYDIKYRMGTEAEESREPGG